MLVGLSKSSRVSITARAAVVVAVMLTTAVAALPAVAAQPTPSAQTDATYMADGQVRAIASAGGHLWIGGAFDHLLTPGGGQGPAAPGIAALDPNSSAPAGGVSLPALTGGGRFVYDFSLGPNGVLYVAGQFSYHSGGGGGGGGNGSGGKSGKNLVGIDPKTGKIVATFSTEPLRAVFAMQDRVLAGGGQLTAYNLSGSKIASFKPLVAKIDPSLRGHQNTPSLIRDIAVSGGDAFATGEFDFINGHPQKLVVKFNPVNGSVDNWNVAGLTQKSDAWGIQLVIDAPYLYVAAGGSDFTAKYALSDGHQAWKTDTSGSTQSIALWDSSTLIIGGHFDWVADQGAQQCGDNEHPNNKCLHQPKLAALDTSSGRVDASWRPQICCIYNGVWMLLVDGGDLHVGGQFTKAGGRNQHYYAQFP
jgi:hypothetical protein